MKEEMVLKIAILGERFAPSPQWYMDTILKLIKLVWSMILREMNNQRLAQGCFTPL